jgi:drug/metabolite transporter (DMT)-like permease
MRGIIYALAAAVLFGASTPLAKVVLREVPPVMMAGLLNLGSGLGLSIYWVARSFREADGAREARLKKADWPWLAGAIAAGGVAGPVLLMAGLVNTSASSASLLLNLEGVLTAVLAWFVFKENFDKRIAAGMALITAGGVVLSWTGRPAAGAPWGAIAIAGACLAWAIDNNLTRKVSGGDPVQIAMLKGLVAGSVNTGIGLAMGARLPAAGTLAATGFIGLFGYGASLTLFVLALRHIGAARTGAYYSIAPFVGAVIAIAALGDKATAGLLVAGGLMGLGVWLHVTERHEHLHRHVPMEHEHSHVHDEHHQHEHGPNDPPGEPHSHPHWHRELVHSHPHFPDIHHRHGHQGS